MTTDTDRRASVSAVKSRSRDTGVSEVVPSYDLSLGIGDEEPAEFLHRVVSHRRDVVRIQFRDHSSLVVMIDDPGDGNEDVYRCVSSTGSVSQISHAALADMISYDLSRQNDHRTA